MKAYAAVPSDETCIARAAPVGLLEQSHEGDNRFTMLTLVRAQRT